MGKTLRKFSRKGKKTQVRRKTKGKTPTRRKSVRIGRKTGGGRDAGKVIKTEVDGIARLFFTRPRDKRNIIDAKTKLIELSNDGKHSCRVIINKDELCELEKEKQYIKATRVADVLLGSRKAEPDFYRKLLKKTERITKIDQAEDESTTHKKIGLKTENIVQGEHELTVIEILELIKWKPDHYLEGNEKSSEIGKQRCSSEAKNEIKVGYEDEAEEEEEPGLQRIVLDVLEKKEFNEDKDRLDPLELTDLSLTDEYITSTTPLQKYRNNKGGGQLSRTSESYMKTMRCVYNEAVAKYTQLKAIQVEV
jgi:hypothetical protein